MPIVQTIVDDAGCNSWSSLRASARRVQGIVCEELVSKYAIALVPKPYPVIVRRVPNGDPKFGLTLVTVSGATNIGAPNAMP